MSKLKFTPSMFNDPPSDHHQYTSKVEAAETAQALFDAWLEAQPVVYGVQQKQYLGYWDESGPSSESTHRARLVYIEKLQKNRRSLSDIAKDIEANNNRKPTEEEKRELFDALEACELTEKQQCEHQPTGTSDMYGSPCHTRLCIYCGVKLKLKTKAKWEEA